MEYLTMAWEIAGVTVRFFSRNIFWWNLLFAIVIVFFERREPKSVWAWLLLLSFMPFLGFVFYLFLGKALDKRKKFRVKEVEDRLSDIVRYQEQQIKTQDFLKDDGNIADYRDLVVYNLEACGSVLTGDNDVDIFTDGNRKFDALIADLERAEKFIHMQYYIIKDDVLFARLEEVLARKAAQGVQVRILYDGMGGRFVSHKAWKRIREKGIVTAEFFPPLLGRFQPRINYRNHRKIVVIDNRVAYVGGFNIGREYVGLDEKFGYWRDTHLRIRGTGVFGLQLQFILDWNYAARENLFVQEEMYKGLVGAERDHCHVQIISSGPDRTERQIRDNYLRLITKAKESIYIQTPYFIPDDAIMSALLIAVRSGISVNIMIPCMPDHPFVYWATYSYIGELALAGAKCYTYDRGFLHSKGMVVDSRVLCYGTANMDIRSFALNFEVNAVVYHEGKAREMEACFWDDLQYCTQITRELYENRRLLLRCKEQVSRLLSPLL